MANTSTFPFGQFQRSTENRYVELLTLPTIEDYLTIPSDISGESIRFKDKQLIFLNELQQGSYYILKLSILRKDLSEQAFNIYLQNTGNQNDANLLRQFIGRYVVPPKIKTSNISELELIINPKNTYGFIIVEMERTLKDDYSAYNEQVELDYIGRKADITVEKFGRFNNIITNNITLTKIGIQSAPGTLFCINGLGIRVGSSGIYEINNGYEITFLGSAIDFYEDSASQKNYFIIDYRYK